MTMQMSRVVVLILVCALGGCPTASIPEADQESSVQLVRQGIFAKPGSGVLEISTAELEQILQDKSAVLLDTRPHLEWSVSHIPTALNVAPKPGEHIAIYTSVVAYI
jgi:hypothetical protein